MGEPAPERSAFGVLMAANSAGRKRKAEARERSSFAACPLCERSVHPLLLAAHAAECSGRAEQAPSPVLPAPVVTALPTPPPPGAASAFSVLLSSAAEQRPANIGCFVLERDDSSGALRVLWHSSPPPAAALAWRQTMELQGARDETPRRRGTLTLASVLPSAPIAYSWPDPGPGTRGPSVGQLKSAVQKNVRLCRPAAAVRAACALLRADASEGLRRLAVIAAEDAALDSEHFPLLVWATAAAAKGFQPPPAVWALVLRAVHAMASLPLRDPAAHGAAGDGASLFAPPGPPAGEKGGLLVRCCLLRAQLGGMKGDVAMLHGCASFWARRYSDGGDWPDAVEAAFRALPPPEHCLAAAEEAAGPQARCAAEAELESVPPLRAADVPPTALDMHCSSLISDLMRDPRLGGAAAEALDATGMEADAALRSMVWNYRSGLNNKTPKIEEPVEGPLHEAWLLLQPLVDAHQRRLHARALS